MTDQPLLSATGEHDDAVNFDALLNAAVDAVIVINASGSILRLNRAAQSIFGYREDEVVGRNVNILMPETHRHHHDGYLKNYLVTGKAKIIGSGREEVGLRSDGTTFPMFLSVGEAADAAGHQFVGIIRDLSRQREIEDAVRRLEQQLAHADRLVTLGELTAGIAHEINQPLTAIAAYADAGEQLERALEDQHKDDRMQIFQRIAEQARRAGAVVQRLRKLSRSGTASKGWHNLNDVIQNVLLLFQYEKQKPRISLQVLTDEGLPDLYLDEIQIQQVLVNLIKNAMESITEAGISQGKITIQSLRSGDGVTIEVRDNGPGISPDRRNQLFEPFFTTKANGLGLGLSICKRIAVAHGGSLLHRESNGETCFALQLPGAQVG
jgi:two-component system sensor kinase FixL